MIRWLDSFRKAGTRFRKSMWKWISLRILKCLFPLPSPNYYYLLCFPRVLIYASPRSTKPTSILKYLFLYSSRSNSKITNMPLLSTRPTALHLHQTSSSLNPAPPPFPPNPPTPAQSLPKSIPIQQMQKASNST